MGFPVRTLLTVKDVADIFSVHENTVRRWSNNGKIKAYRISKRGDRRYFLEDVSEFIHQLKQNNGDVRKVSIVNSEIRDLMV